MNKFIILSCAAIISLVSASCSQTAYRIEGKYTTPDGTAVSLVDLDSRDTLARTAVSGNAFVIEGKLREPVFVYLGNGSQRIRFILEGGTVKADIDERTESGTPMLDAYNAFNTRYYAFDRYRNLERKELQSRQEELSDSEFNALWDSLDRTYAARQAALADSLVRANMDNILGAVTMEDLAAKDTSLFMARYRDLPERWRGFYKVSDARDNIVSLARTAPGKMFTDYLVPGGNPDGSDASLSDYIGRGKYILLDHWASWCGPCKAEMPYIRKTWEAFHGDRFDVVSVAVNDKREDSLKALSELDMPWIQILDAQRLPIDIYNVTAIPHLILFAPDGTILTRGIRGEQIYTTVAEVLR